MNVEKSAGIIFFNNLKSERLYLVIRASRLDQEKLKPEFWDFPKGLLEVGEQGIDAAIRESKEETGIENFKIIDGFKETVQYFTKRDEKTALKFAAMFLAECFDENIKLSWEHDKYEWLKFSEAREKISRTEMKKTLEKADIFLTNSYLTT